MFQDGAEYDEYGNRKKYGSGTLPRGYDRGWITSQLQLFASYNATVCFKG